MATRIGLEPTTPSVTGWCSNQLSYRAMIAQVRAASYRGNVLYYIGKSACCQAQICGKCNFLQKGGKDPFRLLPLVAATFPKGMAFGGGGEVSGQSHKACGRGRGSKKTKRTSSEEPVRHGRGSKFRTHGTRFWRPLLYQLSYTPIYIR